MMLHVVIVYGLNAAKKVRPKQSIALTYFMTMG